MLLVLRSILLWVLSNNVAGHLVVNLQNHFKFYNVLFSVVKNRKY